MRTITNLILLVITTSLFSRDSHAQEKLIDNTTSKHWVSLKDIGNHQPGIISAKGNFFSYTFGSKEGGDSIVIASADGSFQLKEKLSSNFSTQFSPDERYVYFKYSTDSLAGYDLKSRSIIFKFKNVQGIQILGSSPKPILVVTYDNGIGIHSYTGKTYKMFPNLWRTSISADSKSLVLSSNVSIVFLSLPDMKETIVTSGKEIDCVKVDEKTKLVTWTTLELNGSFTSWKFNQKLNHRFKVFNSKDIGIEGSLKPMQQSFSPKSNGMVFQIMRRDHSTGQPKNPTIWSYNDFYVTNLEEDKALTFYFDLKKRKLSLLFNESERMLGSLDKMAERGRVVTETTFNVNEFGLNKPSCKAVIYDLENDVRQEVTEQFPGIIAPYFSCSPYGKFLYWWSSGNEEYMCYNIKTGKTASLTKDIDSKFFESENEMPNRREPYGTIAWGSNDEFILIYDQFDVWQVDPTGVKSAKNMTYGEGKKTNTKIRFVLNKPTISIGDTIIVSLFNVDSKQNGLMCWNIKDRFSLQFKHLADYCYRDNKSSTSARFKTLEYSPVKAANSAKYLVRRESSTESGNLFLTSDFLNYSQITNIAPEKRYLWYKNRLIEWKGNDGQVSRGILYYPQNLNTDKKYPLIVHYYEKKSDELNVFKEPTLSDGEIDIAWYTSHGYVVFLPDLHYETKSLRASLKQTLYSALKGLSTFSWVDVNNAGIQGHSFGGFETFSLITSMNFKAAQASAGISEWISFHSHIFMDGTREGHVEYDQGNMGTTPWSDPEVYTKNSPALFLDSVNTPLLIMHGKQDYNVPINQSYQMYVGLRRLKKPVWLISYSDEDHNLINEGNQLDFTVKQQEFFGYFLKGEKKPEWLR